MLMLNERAREAETTEQQQNQQTPRMTGNGVKMASSAELFKTTLNNIYDVLKAADKTDVLNTLIPHDFIKKDPLQITAAYNSLKQTKPEFKTTSMTAKFEAGKYKSPYQFYHDIRLASYIRINDIEIGSPDYVEVDRFFKFSTELFLRECYRLRISIDELKNKSKAQWEDHEESNFEEMLADDFDRISTSYNFGHSEAYVVLTQNSVPLFTTLNERSALDERQVILPDPVTSTKVIPTINSMISMPLGDVSPNISRLPQLNSQTVEILSRFLHPNWYSLPTAKWLETSDLLSFSPVVDEQTFVVSSTDKGRLWLENIGHKKLDKWRKESGLEDEEMKDVDIDGTTQTQDAPKEGEKNAEDDVSSKVDEVETFGELTKDDYFNLYEWSPYNSIDDGEIDAFENGTEQQYLNEQLIKLQSLREERYAKGLKKPSTDEETVYYKCFRLLKEIIYVEGSIPDLKPSSLLPTEQFVYSGTLPVPQQNTNASKRKYKTRGR